MAWQPASTMAHIQPLDLSKSVELMPPELKAYEEYYGLNFEYDIKDINHTIGFINVDQFRIVVHVFRAEQAKGTVYLHHGYYDHVGLYGKIIKHCLLQGYSVFTYDLPGHGLSNGEQAGIDSFDQYDQVFCEGLRILKQFLPGPIVAIGQSTGCAIITNYLLSRGLNQGTSPFSKIVFLAPLVRPIDWKISVWFYFVARYFIKQMKRTFAVNSNDSEFLDFLKNKDPLQSLYLKVSWVGALHKWIKFIERSEPVDVDIRIIQGTCDGTVDSKHNIKVLAEKFNLVELTYIEDGRHQLANEEHSKLTQVLSKIQLP